MERSSGIFLHITSLPSKYGIGTLGKASYEFVDFLAKSNVKIWQILPLNLTSYGDSPYQSPSNYGYSYYLIDFDVLIEKGLLKKSEVNKVKWFYEEDRTNFEIMFNEKTKLLKLAFSRFNKTSKRGFKTFLKENKNASDFSFYMTLKTLHNFRPWNEWNLPYSIELEKRVKKENKDLYEFFMWTQFEFLDEYKKLKKYANKKNIKIMGDIPIYLAFDSIECYKFPQMFEFDEKHNPINVAGCPPDCFSETGQLWGNPLYNWEYLKSTNYKWWNERINNALNLYDLVRIDHFRGFSAYYSIPYGDETAINGKRVKGPGIELFKDKLDYPIVAEDLGFMDEDFEKLMKEVKYPGMKIFVQGILNDKEDSWRAPNFDKTHLIYTSTHDSETALEYYDELSEDKKKLMIENVKEDAKYFNIDFKEEISREELEKLMIEISYASDAICVITPMWDLLSLGAEGRMNKPSTLSTSNWSWRMEKMQFEKNKLRIAGFLNNLNTKYRR